MDTVYVYLSCFSHVVRLVDIHVCADLPFHDRVRVRVGVTLPILTKHISIFYGRHSDDMHWRGVIFEYFGPLSTHVWFLEVVAGQQRSEMHLYRVEV